MPTPVSKKAGNGVTSWSWSRLADYELCPAKFKFKVLDKLKEPSNAAMERGTAIHKLAEDYTLGKIAKLPVELARFKDEFKRLKAQKVKFVEENWAWTAKFGSETAWNDWNGAWVRMKIDAGYIVPQYNAVVVIDHKTGKLKDGAAAAGYDAQLELSALGALLKYPDMDVASPRNWYLDHGVIYPDPQEREVEITRDEVPELKRRWLARVEPLFVEKKWAPRENALCKWCHYRRSNGGPCTKG